MSLFKKVTDEVLKWDKVVSEENDCKPTFEIAARELNKDIHDLEYFDAENYGVELNEELEEFEGCFTGHFKKVKDLTDELHFQSAGLYEEIKDGKVKNLIIHWYDWGFWCYIK